MRIDVHIHQGHGVDDSKLDRILELLEGFTEGMRTMSVELDQLTVQVKANTDVEASAVVLLKGLAAQITSLKNDPVALAALAASLNTSAQSLSEAVVANTPAA